MTEVRCPWDYCVWNIGFTCTRHVIILTSSDECSILDCAQYDDQWQKDGERNDKD
jgi:hypothetical protein